MLIIILFVFHYDLCALGGHAIIDFMEPFIFVSLGLLPFLIILFPFELVESLI